MNMIDLLKNIDGLVPRTEFSGLYAAVVISNEDPEQRGRLRVFIPGIHPKDSPENNYPWAEICAQGVGPGRGALKIPKVDETVWIMFNQGDPERPVWMGSWWGAPGGQTELPEEIKRPKSDEHYVIKTDGGNLIDMSDEEGKVGITIKIADGKKVSLDNSNNKIDITDGDSSIVIDTDNDKIIVRGGSEVDLEISGKSVKINGATNIPDGPSSKGCFSGLTHCLFTGGPHLTDKVK